LKIKAERITKCKCNAGGLGIPAFLPCSTTANPSLTDDGAKMKNSKKPAWLRADLKGNRFEIRSATCTNRCGAFKKVQLTKSLSHFRLEKNT
jgi:hypothetical protein